MFGGPAGGTRFVASGRWLRAADLAVGDRVPGRRGSLLEVVRTEREPHPEGVVVYNFEVAGAHTYYVASPTAPRAPPVLAHNNCSVSWKAKLPVTPSLYDPDYLKYVRDLQNSGRMVVSRWGRRGLTAGDWVMKGGVTRKNFFLSFKWDPNPTNIRVPFKDWRNGESFVVPKS